MSVIYGYCRISTKEQKLQRQIDNIKQYYPNAIFYTESFTGTKIDRPEWNKLMKNVKTGDTIVFDEVSRMSRNADEGFKAYQELFDKGIILIFLKEPMLNTDVFKEVQTIAKTGNDIADIYIDATNQVLMLLAEKQIKSAFESAQREVDYLRQRTKEGIAVARKNGSQIGLKKGTKLNTDKVIKAQKDIKKYSKDFDGTLKDVEVMKIIGLCKNTYYKYKRDMR